METITPPDSDNGAATAPRPRPAATTRTPPPTAPGGTGIGLAGLAGLVAVLALIFATVALVMGGDDDGDTGAPGAGTTTVELTEFAISPATLSVPAGGSLEVTNAGAAVHNLSLEGTDITTADLDGGASETLDLSSLAPGEYGVLCTIPGHADAGMRGTLTVTEGTAGGGGGLDASGASSGDAGDGGAAGQAGQLTEADYAEMSRAMNESIAQFPAETEGQGNQLLEPTTGPGGVKVFELTAEVTPWQVDADTTVDAWTYNGVVPGPQIRLDVGDEARIVLRNELPMATDLHLHGINVTNDMDGVAPITQPLVEPGESFSYEFTADEPAVAMYHAHHHGQMQVPNGLLGTVFVGDMALPTGRTISGRDIPDDLDVALEMPLVLNDSGVIGYSLNGKSFPATAPITAQQGDWILVHYFNEGSQIHPMHLHQFDQVVVAKDGFPLDEPYLADTINVAPGERYSVLVQVDKPGTWVWHCHILNHVERETGMYGMVTAVVVE